MTMRPTWWHTVCWVVLLLQILRSCPSWASGLQIPEASIHKAYIDVIEKSEHYIYIEVGAVCTCGEVLSSGFKVWTELGVWV